MRTNTVWNWFIMDTMLSNSYFGRKSTKKKRNRFACCCDKKTKKMEQER